MDSVLAWIFCYGGGGVVVVIMYSRISCICLTFLHCVFPAVVKASKLERGAAVKVMYRPRSRNRPQARPPLVVGPGVQVLPPPVIDFQVFNYTWSHLLLSIANQSWVPGLDV